MAGYDPLSARTIYVDKAFGTVLRVTIAGKNTCDFNRIRKIVRQEINMGNKAFSKWDPDSEISRINRHAGSHHASEALWSVLWLSQVMCRMTNGIFNVAYRTRGLDKYGCYGFRLLEHPYRVKTYPNVVLDLDGIAKGWVIGRIARLLKQSGCTQFMVEIGGDIMAGQATGQPWRVGVKIPTEPGVAMVLRVKKKAVFTSGTYARGNHIVDPVTGKKAVHGYSATVIGPDPAIADALATAAFISGPKADYYRMFPGYGVLFVSPDGRLLDAEGVSFDETDFPFLRSP